MSHLAPSEFIDLLDGTLAPERAAHASTCERCRAEAATLARTLGEARDVATPEPSPLFWEHFSARVRTAINEAGSEGTRETSWLWWLKRPAIAFVAAASLAVGGLAWWYGSERGATPPPSTAGARVDGFLPLDVPAGEAGWEVVAAAADTAEWDDEEMLLDTFAIRPGAAERAVVELTEQQREELAALLREEIGRTKS